MTAPAWARHLAPGVDPGGLDLLTEGSLPRAWSARWAEAPAHAVVRDVDGSWLDAGTLAERTAAVARRLLAAGLRPGDRVLLSGPTSASYVVAHVAVLRAGLVVVPVNPASASRELDGIIDDARPAAALLADARMRAWAQQRAPGLAVADPELGGWSVGADDPGAGSGAAGEPALDRTGPDDPALLPYTSGTTGAPKGVPLSHGNLLASAEALRLAWRWRADDRLILCLPLFHMHGMGVGLHGTLLAGASAILHDGFEPERVLADADGATLLFGVPTMYRRLVDAPGADRLASLRLCVSGSAPLSAEMHERVRACSGQVVLERYGMTETVMLVSNPLDGERRAGTVGLPLPGVELRLAAPSGEIEVRGPNVFSGYLDRPDANAVAFTDDGWFRTGDIGAIDDDGYVSIVGRAKELIISGGYNVYPREVEDVLRGHPTVVDVAVVGTPSDEWGEVVTAYVEATDELDVEHLLAWVAEQVTHYKRPRLVHRVDALPRNSLGKVVRHELRPPG